MQNKNYRVLLSIDRLQPLRHFCRIQMSTNMLHQSLILSPTFSAFFAYAYAPYSLATSYSAATQLPASRHSSPNSRRRIPARPFRSDSIDSVSPASTLRARDEFHLVFSVPTQLPASSHPYPNTKRDEFGLDYSVATELPPSTHTYPNTKRRIRLDHSVPTQLPASTHTYPNIKRRIGLDHSVPTHLQTSPHPYPNSKRRIRP
ncbi:hypothetical protein Tcan_10264 [Toxocara canis]|uniref:Uncharacterized protein n=1 Tax=Toxocara canis TaxID=6265 RepID=A0A0B2UI01_TOXCA|nr:hypothetical protein Tcan_10264 [Toxocara canis]